MARLRRLAVALSKETRVKLGWIVQNAHALLDAITESDSSPQIYEAITPLCSALGDFEEHLYSTVADVMAREVRAPASEIRGQPAPRARAPVGSPIIEEATDGLFVKDADGIPEPGGGVSPLRADDPDVVTAPNPDPDDERPVQVSDPDLEPDDDEAPF